MVLVPDLARLCVAGRGDATRTVILNILEELRTAPMNLFPRDSHNISIRSVCGVRPVSRPARGTRSRGVAPPRPAPARRSILARPGAPGGPAAARRSRLHLHCPFPLVRVSSQSLRESSRIFQLLQGRISSASERQIHLLCFVTRERVSSTVPDRRRVADVSSDVLKCCVLSVRDAFAHVELSHSGSEVGGYGVGRGGCMGTSSACACRVSCSCHVHLHVTLITFGQSPS